MTASTGGGGGARMFAADGSEIRFTAGPSGSTSTDVQVHHVQAIQVRLGKVCSV